MSDENKNCLLCGEKSEKKTPLLWECLRCGLLFKDPDLFWGEEQEKARYATHNNDVTDEGYLKYLNKLFSIVETRSGLVLDYGCGPEKGLEALVANSGYKNLIVESYDPMFFPEINMGKKYDLIFASECLEHFYKPAEELVKLKNLLKNSGELAVSTNFYKGQDLSKWWYLNDPTHVAFYSEKTFEFISNEYGFNISHSKDPHVILKPSA